MEYQNRRYANEWVLKFKLRRAWSFFPSSSDEQMSFQWPLIPQEIPFPSSQASAVSFTGICYKDLASLSSRYAVVIGRYEAGQGMKSCGF